MNYKEGCYAIYILIGAMQCNVTHHKLFIHFHIPQRVHCFILLSTKQILKLSLNTYTKRGTRHAAFF
jgi:hypothetical protein